MLSWNWMTSLMTWLSNEWYRMQAPNNLSILTTTATKPMQVKPLENIFRNRMSVRPVRWCNWHNCLVSESKRECTDCARMWMWRMLFSFRPFSFNELLHNSQLNWLPPKNMYRAEIIRLFRFVCYTNSQSQADTAHTDITCVGLCRCLCPCTDKLSNQLAMAIRSISSIELTGKLRQTKFIIIIVWWESINATKCGRDKKQHTDSRHYVWITFTVPQLNRHRDVCIRMWIKWNWTMKSTIGKYSGDPC